MALVSMMKLIVFILIYPENTIHNFRMHIMMFVQRLIF